MKQTYDIAIIGSGMAGSFAALKIAEEHKNKSVIIFELGRPPGKRRRQLEGWFGCFPTGDGKIYANDADKVSAMSDGRKVKGASNYFQSKLKEIEPLKLIKTKLPNNQFMKKAKELGFSLDALNYVQWHPDNIHALSKSVADKIENAGNVEFSFDNEVFSINKKHNIFHVTTVQGDFHARKLIFAAGRTGWRWVNKIYKELGVLTNDSIATYGIKIEMPAQYLKELNSSHCSLYRDDLMLGPFSWDGSMIQEDHADLTIASFRSNEARWKTDKVFFSLISRLPVKNDDGCYQTDRLGKLSFLLFGDRVGREKVKTLQSGNSQLNLIPEYNWLQKSITETAKLIPQLITRGYYHAPDIYTSTLNINIGKNMNTDIEGMFVAGESAGIQGIAAAAITGILAAEGACK